MIQALVENPVLLLFIVAAIGYGAGSMRIRGTSLGVAAVLFVGLLFGSISPDFNIPKSLIFLGLAIYIYTIGLASGPGFFTTFRQRGFRDVFFVLAMLAFSVGLSVGLHHIFHFDATTTAGLFAGSTTNTPALAGLLDMIQNAKLTPEKIVELGQQTVTGYSLAYPMGVIGTIFAIQLMTKLLKIDFKAEEEELSKDYPSKQDIITKTVLITKNEYTNLSIRDLKYLKKWKVAFGRVQSGDEITLSNWDTHIRTNDKIVVTGAASEVHKVMDCLGCEAPEQIPFQRSEYVTKRIFVSNPEIAGEKLSTLNLSERFAAIVTRIRRGDIDILAAANTPIELGDQVIFIARRKDVPAIKKLFGDSYDSLSSIDLLSFGLGIAMGLLLGLMTIELPGGMTFKLGYAGGPIIVALILGTLRRTGPLVWSLPYGANRTLRQLGLIIMLAGIGINSGHTFMNTLAQGSGGIIFLAGGILSFLTAITTLFVGYKLLKIPYSFLLGMVSTQPAILDFALDKTKNNLPIIGFTLILPVALIIKVLYAQVLYNLLN